MQLAATGTDGPVEQDSSEFRHRAAAVPELWIEAGAPLNRVLVSHEQPVLSALMPPAWRQSLTLVGPVLTLCGLIYLAFAVGPLLERSLS